MKLIHLSDLHLGKRVNEFSMLEDQQYILSQILQISDAESPDAVLVAGDIWDKPLPSAEAITLFDNFLFELSLRKIAVFLIPGNHDSAERVAFGGRLMEKSRVFCARPFSGLADRFVLTDEFGPVHFFLLPFLKPMHVRRFYPDASIETTQDALQVVLDYLSIDCTQRNVLIAHQFVTGAVSCDSEELSVGGSDQVDAALFSRFDYTALGHIHNSQTIGTPTLRYCGSPLKYSFSEAKHEKSVTIVELEQKGSVRVRTVPLLPKHDLKEIRGTYDEITAKSYYDQLNQTDYLHITLTDEEDIPDAVGKLRVIYPNLMKLDYDNRRTQSVCDFSDVNNTRQKSPMELLSEFYQAQNGLELTEAQNKLAFELIESIWDDPTLF